jgi:hypothetical protein
MHETSSARNSRFAIASQPPVMALLRLGPGTAMTHLPPFPHPAQTPPINTSRDQP